MIDDLVHKHTEPELYKLDTGTRKCITSMFKTLGKCIESKKVNDIYSDEAKKIFDKCYEIPSLKDTLLFYNKEYNLNLTLEAFAQKSAAYFFLVGKYSANYHKLTKRDLQSTMLEVSKHGFAPMQGGFTSFYKYISNSQIDKVEQIFNDITKYDNEINKLKNVEIKRKLESSFVKQATGLWKYEVYFEPTNSKYKVFGIIILTNGVGSNQKIVSFKVLQSEKSLKHSETGVSYPSFPPPPPPPSF